MVKRRKSHTFTQKGLDKARRVCYALTNKIRVEFYSILLLFATQWCKKPLCGFFACAGQKKPPGYFSI